jgi:hypothetical protein
VNPLVVGQWEAAQELKFAVHRTLAVSQQVKRAHLMNDENSMRTVRKNSTALPNRRPHYGLR